MVCLITLASLSAGLIYAAPCHGSLLPAVLAELFKPLPTNAALMAAERTEKWDFWEPLLDNNPQELVLHYDKDRGSNFISGTR